MATAVGMSAPTTAASVRAGVSRFHETDLEDRRGEPIVMAMLPDEALPPLDGALERDPWMTALQARMLRIAAGALRETLDAAISRVERIPLLLAVPEPLPGRSPPVAPGFLRWLGVQAGVDLAWERSRAFPLGRAGGIAALGDALARIASLSDPYVLVGGVDSYRDPDLLDALDKEGRIRAAGVTDGFIPGEGAGFVLLASDGRATQQSRAALARVDAAAIDRERGHRYATEPYRGDGLDGALRALFEAVSGGSEPVHTVYAGLNGEHFHAKEWGVASIRHQPHFAEDLAIEHPIDCLGDTGAALAPLMIGLAALGAQRGYRRSPCLVWCSSDLETRGAALVRAVTPAAKGSAAIPSSRGRRI
jgi:3-oxoacyl-[acyl-carrier-protein] synthase-1